MLRRWPPRRLRDPREPWGGPSEALPKAPGGPRTPPGGSPRTPREALKYPGNTLRLLTSTFQGKPKNRKFDDPLNKNCGFWLRNCFKNESFSYLIASRIPPGLFSLAGSRRKRAIDPSINRSMDPSINRSINPFDQLIIRPIDHQWID